MLRLVEHLRCAVEGGKPPRLDASSGQARPAGAREAERTTGGTARAWPFRVGDTRDRRHPQDCPAGAFMRCLSRPQFGTRRRRRRDTATPRMTATSSGCTVVGQAFFDEGRMMRASADALDHRSDQSDPTSRPLTRNSAAAFLAVSTRTLDRLAQAGEVCTYRIGGHRRFPVEVIGCGRYSKRRP
jgi:excisionase family DNA binding protein